MSGGSADDACLSIAHKDENTERVVVDVVISQTGAAPFNPRTAVRKFSETLKQYGIREVTGDSYAGETFRRDFQDHQIDYRPCPVSKSALYEEIEPMLNSRELELPDVPKLQEQMLGLVWRGSKIDHMNGEHDDFANAACGAAWLYRPRLVVGPKISNFDYDPQQHQPRGLSASFGTTGEDWIRGTGYEG